MTEQTYWRAVENRDQNFDGRFVFAVVTTGVYCRPSCPCRRPKQENARFYDVPAAAEADGFRPCKRCRPNRTDIIDPMMAAIEDAARQIERALAQGEDQMPGLDSLAERAGFSSSHFQRSFSKALGISPKQYLDARRLIRLKQGLKEGEGVTQAVYGAGYGSTSRVYGKADKALGMTAGMYAKGAPGVAMNYGFAESQLGLVLAAATERGVSAVYLGDDTDKLARELAIEYPGAILTEDSPELSDSLGVLVAYLNDRGPHPDLPLDVRATAFQWRVWQELMKIPYGEVLTYGQIAERLGKPTASRAVGRACGLNPVSLAIPCHRAVGSDGKLHGYRWGLDRKQALLDLEKAGCPPPPIEFRLSRIGKPDAQSKPLT